MTILVRLAFTYKAEVSSACHLICEGRCWLKGKCRSRALIVAAVPNIFEEIRLLLEWLEQFAPIQQAKGPDWLHSLGGQ